ncbi:hypothetical protein F3Y22_tig00111027pilonHSYRG00545 [Hibiscus syriacus]|uniref:RNase H type-1 domain-containing protein n=1 Tax=Hibiscus syriacus TaxID=106335 RepID=A0A6A2Z4M0_HIBSY|nr:hypothetical protein F3Y22_tig00111027pilonHSYRG00545 [Hibiscus syriacus]
MSFVVSSSSTVVMKMKSYKGKLPLSIITVSLCSFAFLALLYTERLSFLSSDSILKAGSCARRSAVAKAKRIVENPDLDDRFEFEPEECDITRGKWGVQPFYQAIVHGYEFKNWANYFITTTPDSLTDTAFPRPELIQWRPAPAGWFTLNTDGAVHHTSSLGSAGLQLAWSQRLEHLQCQTDCAEALTLVTSSTAASSPVSIVRSIASLISKQWKVDFILIRREANAAADFLEKSTVVSNDQTCIYIESPQEIIPHLARDLHGPVFTRS